MPLVIASFFPDSNALPREICSCAVFSQRYCAGDTRDHGVIHKGPQMRHGNLTCSTQGTNGITSHTIEIRGQNNYHQILMPGQSWYNAVVNTIWWWQRPNDDYNGNPPEASFNNTFNQIRAWVINYIHGFLSDVITHPCSTSLVVLLSRRWS